MSIRHSPMSKMPCFRISSSERSPLVELVQYLGNGGGDGFRTADFVGRFHHGVGVAAMAKLLVTLFSQCHDGIDIGPGQIRGSVNIAVAGTRHSRLDPLRVDKGAFEFVIDEPGCRARGSRALRRRCGNRERVLSRERAQAGPALYWWGHGR